MQLIEILNKEKNILIDGSIHEDSVDIARDIYEKTNYGQLDINKLNLAIEDFENFEEIIKQPQVYTIRALTKELQGIETIFSQKIKNFNNFEKLRGKRVKIIYKKYYHNQKKALLKLQEITYRIRRTSKTKELDNFIDNAKYNPLLNLIKSISFQGKLKKDNSYNSDTDERLTATLFYFSFYSNKSFSFLAEDKDFKKLIKTSSNLLNCNMFLPNNKDIQRRLNENPFRFYHKRRNKGDYKFIFDSKRITPFEFFNHPKLTNSQNRSLRKIAYKQLPNLSKDYTHSSKS